MVRTLSPIHYVQKMHSQACQYLSQRSWQHHLPHTIRLHTRNWKIICNYCTLIITRNTKVIWEQSCRHSHTENNYATKSPSVTMGCPTFTPKTAHFYSMISTPSYTPIPRLTPLTTPNGIQIQSAICPQYTLQTDTHRQTDRQRHRQRERERERERVFYRGSIVSWLGCIVTESGQSVTKIIVTDPNVTPLFCNLVTW